MARRRKPADDLADATLHPPQHIPAGQNISFAVMMPGYRVRHDGWNQQRVQRFLDTLAHTGCVQDAARVAGMSAVAGRRAQKRYPLFAAAWDDALDRSRQGLIAIAYKRAVEGRETIIIRKGEEFERRIEPSDAMLRLLIKQGDMSGEKLARSGDDVLTFDEFKAGWTFKKHGGKWKPPTYEEARARLEAKFAVMHTRLVAADNEARARSKCGGPLPEGEANESLLNR